MPSRNQNQNNNNNNSNDRGKGKKNVKKDKNEASGIPIDKLQFSVGRNQIENYEKLIKHLANKAQNKCGAQMACILLNEQEYNFTVPTLETLDTIDEDGDTAVLRRRKE